MTEALGTAPLTALAQALLPLAADPSLASMATSSLALLIFDGLPEGWELVNRTAAEQRQAAEIERLREVEAFLTEAIGQRDERLAELERELAACENRDWE